MFLLTHNLPMDQAFFYALSGGIDSMAGLHWLSNSNRYPKAVIYVNHGTQHGEIAEHFVKDFCNKNRYNLEVVKLLGSCPKKASKEDWWRKGRLAAFNGVADKYQVNYPVITAHNLDDSVEQYVLNTFVRFNNNMYINYAGPSNVIRPFRAWSRESISYYVDRHSIPYIEDDSNSDITFKRNFIRNKLIKELIVLNPGLYVRIQKEILADPTNEIVR